MILDNELRKKINRAIFLDNITKELNKEYDDLKKDLIQSVPDGKVETTAGIVVYEWKEYPGRNSIDMESLKKDYPDIYNKYLKIGTNYKKSFLKTKTEISEN